MKKITKWTSLVMMSMLLMSGCSQTKETNNVAVEETASVSENVAVEETEPIEMVEVEEVEPELTIEERMANVDLSKKPNELGKIMVLMYHHIAEPEAEWSRTPQNFRQDLETLYNEGYRTISLKDYAQNNIEVEAGYTPVVITFDDGNQNNFNILSMEDGKAKIDPDCAVGIMEQFSSEHPDFGNNASFFVYGNEPFGQEEYVDYKLNYLIEKGFNLGNHTQSHNDLKAAKNQSADTLQRVIGKQVARIESKLNDKEYKIDTIALPFGHHPKDKLLEKYVAKGIYEGNEYENLAILNVGWDPYYSPVDKKFDPTSIHRIRAGIIKVDNVGILDWIESFRKHPDRKYISDGEADIITIPANLQDRLSEEKSIEKALNIYEIN